MPRAPFLALAPPLQYGSRTEDREGLVLRILGPFQDDGGFLLPRGAQGTLLSLLLLDAGEPVSVGALSERLFAVHAPERVQVTVSRVRRRLREADVPCGIRTVDGGYVLDVEPAHLDRHRFESLLADARIAEGTDRRLALLVEACALWRGPILAEIGLEGEPTARRLEQHWLRALEQRHRLALELGAAADFEDLLTARSQHPFHEGLTAVSMLALYRAGRQVEALRIHEALRRRLRDELGLEPGHELKALERSILRQELRFGGAGRPAPPPPTASIPPPPVRLLGRDADLAALRTRVEQRSLVTILGPAGVGKTALADALLAEESARGRAVARADLAPVSAPVEAVQVLARALMVDVPGDDGAGADLAEAIGARTVLLLLDNCEHLHDAVRSIASTLLSRCRGVRLLATSRHLLQLRDEDRFSLEALPSPVAVDLLRLRLEALGARLPDDPGSHRRAAELCEQLDRLPLAIELAARPLALLGLDELSARLDHRLRLLRNDGEGDARHVSLERAISGSFDLLDADHQRVLVALSAFVGSFDLAAAHAVAAEGFEQAEADGAAELDTFDALRSLVDHSLLVRDHAAIGRFRLLESVRAFGQARLSRHDQLRLRQRHAEVMANRMVDAWSQLCGAAEPERIRRIEADVDDLRRAVGRAIATGRADLALTITAPLVLYQFDHLWLEPADWAAAAIELSGADRHPLAALAHVTMGYGLQQRGRYEEALAQGRRADELDEMHGRPPSWITATLLGAATAYLGRRSETRSWADIAVARARAVGDDYGVSRCLWTQVYSAASEGRYDLHVAEEAFRLAERTGSLTARTRAHVLMGIVHALDEPAQARTYCRVAQQLAERAGLHYYVGIARAYAAHALGLEDPQKGMAEFVELLGWYLTTAVPLGASRSLVREAIPMLVALGLDELAAALDGSEPPFCYRPGLNADAVGIAAGRLGPERYARASARWRGMRESDLLGQLARAIPDELVPASSPLRHLRAQQPAAL